MEWKSGMILRIRDYKFEDDGSIRDKYAIVLLVNDAELYLIHSLTTSQNNLSVPALQYGCSVSENIPYFFFPQGTEIGDQRFSFEKDTFIFFRSNVRKEAYDKFNKASQTLFGVVNLGTLTNDELKRIIKCALKSNFIPKNVEQELLKFKQGL